MKRLTLLLGSIVIANLGHAASSTFQCSEESLVWASRSKDKFDAHRVEKHLKGKCNLEKPFSTLLIPIAKGTTPTVMVCCHHKK